MATATAAAAPAAPISLLQARQLALCLTHAVWQNNVPVVKQLLAAEPERDFWKTAIELMLVNADCDASIPKLHSPLHYAVALNSRDSLDLLLGCGLRVDLRDPKTGSSALGYAASQGNGPLLQALIDHGANPNVQDFNGYTALMWAVELNRNDLVQYLLDNNANVNIGSLTGESPLHTAVRVGNTDAVPLLLERGAFVNAVDEEGDSPLHVAAREGRDEVYKYLISRGASAELRNDDGETAQELQTALLSVVAMQ